MQELDYKEEIEKLVKVERPITEGKTDAQIDQMFLEEYKNLTRKYNRDFAQGQIQIVKVEFKDTKI
jgi:hypothetical protein